MALKKSDFFKKWFNSFLRIFCVNQEKKFNFQKCFFTIWNVLDSSFKIFLMAVKKKYIWQFFVLLLFWFVTATSIIHK